MFVRGGVYRVVKEAMGGTLAKFSVSALLFDYVLTGPISAVSAGQYLAGFIVETSRHFGHPLPAFPANTFAAMFGVVIALYFWWKNIQGIHESSQKAVQIMIITTVMVVILLLWCTITVFKIGIQWPPNPMHLGVVPLNRESLGWLNGTWLSHLSLIIFFVGFGHSVLAMSGEETLAQVNREIEHPKLKNLEKTGLVIFIYSLLFTSLVSFFAVMIIPDHVRPEYFGNLIGGLAMFVVGPTWAKLIFRGFVVLVGVLILAGAQNTSIVGANGVLNRLAEDGVLTPALQKPHHHYGTTYRIINLIVAHAVAHHHRHPGQRILAGRLVRVRRHLELFADVAGGAGAPLQRTRPAAVESARQPDIVRHGNSAGAGRDFGGALHDRDREFLHQVRSNHRGRDLQRRLLRCIHVLRAPRCQGAERTAGRAGAVPRVR